MKAFFLTAALILTLTQVASFSCPSYSIYPGVCLDPGHGGPGACKWSPPCTNGDGRGSYGPGPDSLTEAWVNHEIVPLARDLMLGEGVYVACNMEKRKAIGCVVVIGIVAVIALLATVSEKQQRNPADVIEVRVCATEGINIRTGPGVNYEKDSASQLVKGEELYVLEERDGWIRFRCTPKDVGWSGWVKKEFTVSKEEWDRAQEEAAIKAHEEVVKELTKAGLLVRINPELNEAYVEPAIWHGLDYQTKENIGRVMAFYCGRKKGTNLNWVEIKDRYSGKTLAKYSESWGFKVY